LIIDRQSRVVGTPFLDLVEVENLVGVGILQEVPPVHLDLQILVVRIQVVHPAVLLYLQTQVVGLQGTLLVAEIHQILQAAQGPQHLQQVLPVRSAGLSQLASRFQAQQPS